MFEIKIEMICHFVREGCFEDAHDSITKPTITSSSFKCLELIVNALVHLPSLTQFQSAIVIGCGMFKRDYLTLC